MLVALYVGSHARDELAVRIGWRLTRLAQKGEFQDVTHCEAVLRQWRPGVADIASSSLRDGGVRIKPHVALTPGSWRIVDVPVWDALVARAWFEQHAGEPYDTRGALATVLPGRGRAGHWFCNESVGAAVGLRTPDLFVPAQFAAIAFTIGREVTTDFFGGA
ncbi:MAG TPA: hypothetical protein VEA40_21775 [Ramlibacter sp.]|nr:hypothetical protein [Ramlibacter sp.]